MSTTGGESSRQRDTSNAPAKKEKSDNKIAAKPEYFYGDRNRLEAWINQMLIYFTVEQVTKGVNQVLTACSYIRGECEHWIRPKMTAWLGGEAGDPMFASFDTLRAELRTVYGLNNDKQQAIRTIQHLTQKTSTAAYTAKFKEYSDKTGWNNDALITMYYRGLKDNVKDELMRSGADQTTLPLLTKEAIAIDDRLYERAMEKRHTGQFRGRSGYAPTSWSGGQQRRDPDAMEIDVTQKGPRKGFNKGRPKPKARNDGGKERRKGPECYNCHKIGHYKRDCRANKVHPQQMEVNVMTVQENEPPTDNARGAYDTTTPPAERDKHEWLHWTFCYEDSCQTHYSSKMEVGWFPSKPRKEVNVMERTEEEPKNKWNPERDSHEKWIQFKKIVSTPDWSEENQQRALKMLDQLMEEKDNWEKDQAQKGTREIREFNMMSVRETTTQQTRDDGHHARGRSPPPFTVWEDTTLHNDMQESSDEDEQNKENQDPCPRLAIDTGTRELWNNNDNAISETSQEEEFWGNEEINEEDLENAIREQRQQLGISPEEVEEASQVPITRMRVQDWDPSFPNTVIQEPDDYPRIETIPEYGILPEIDDSDAMNDSTPEESDSGEEYSDDEESDDIEILNFMVDSPEPCRKMILHIAQRFEEVFPKIAEKRRLHPIELDNMLMELRTMFWHYRKVNVDYNARDFVQELVPIGSIYGNGGYHAPDGTFISQTMRGRVKLIAKRYQEIQNIQELYQDEVLTAQEMTKTLNEQMRSWDLPPATPLGPPLPVWRGLILGHIHAEIRGQITTASRKGEWTMKPKSGPLNWEISLKNADSPSYYSKNE